MLQAGMTGVSPAKNLRLEGRRLENGSVEWVGPPPIPGRVKRATRSAGVGPIARPRLNRTKHYFINTIFIVCVKSPAFSR
jgi:hypothetical protein